jgi:hypothetical protein
MFRTFLTFVRDVDFIFILSILPLPLLGSVAAGHRTIRFLLLLTLGSGSWLLPVRAVQTGLLGRFLGPGKRIARQVWSCSSDRIPLRCKAAAGGICKGILILL